MTRQLHLDLESYSELNLKTHGVYQYAAHPSTEILMIAWQLDDKPVQLWDRVSSKDPRPPVPVTLWEAFKDPDTLVHAFNVPFERVMLKNIGLTAPLNRWHCSMAHAYALGFSGGLEAIGAQIGLPMDLQKFKAGKWLIRTFGVPRKPSNNNPSTRVWPADEPQKWKEFTEYCRQDVITEKALSQVLTRYPNNATERQLWALDQEINDRGIPVSTAMIGGALELHDYSNAELENRMVEITGVDNPRSLEQTHTWLRENGCPLPDLQAETVRTTLLRLDLSSRVKEVVSIRSLISKTSVTKWQALQRTTGTGDRIRGCFQFNGAQRTGRWSGRIYQPHNLPRPNIKEPELIGTLLEEKRFDVLATLWEEPAALLLSDTLRAVITAPKGKCLVVSDFASIESRVLAWLTGCKRLLNLFAVGRDSYIDMASSIFNVPYDQVTKAQRLYAKPAALASGYGLGATGLIAYAKGMGVELEQEASERIIYLFRNIYPEIPTMWYWLNDAVIHVTRSGETLAHNKISISRDKHFLFIRLPSGRCIFYYQPEVLPRKTSWGETKDTFTYMGQNAYTKQWERLSSFGGKIVENLVQGIARDLLAVWLLRARDHGFTPVLHCHDEIACEEETDRLDELNQLAEKPVQWAPGLLLAAAGYTAQRYRKG